MDIDPVSRSSEGVVVTQGFPDWGVLVSSLGEQGFNQDSIINIDPTCLMLLTLYASAVNFHTNVLFWNPSRQSGRLAAVITLWHSAAFMYIIYWFDTLLLAFLLNQTTHYRNDASHWQRPHACQWVVKVLWILYGRQANLWFICWKIFWNSKGGYNIFLMLAKLLITVKSILTLDRKYTHFE